MSKMLLLAVLASIALPAALPAATAQSTTLKATFEGQLRFGTEKPSEIAFNGSVVWAEPNLRIEGSDALTQEQKILLVNFDEAQAVLLYPETLNGYRASLAQFDASGHLARLRDLLNGKTPQTPEGWKKESLAKESINGKPCAHLRYTRDEQHFIDLWLNAKKRPERMILTKKDLSFTFDATRMSYGEKIPADAFTYSKDYTVQDYDADGDTPRMLL